MCHSPLSQQCNPNASTPPKSPVTAQFPVTARDRDAARTGRGLISAPAPTRASEPVPDLRGQDGAACGAKFEYSPVWANRLPETFAVSPAARLTDAAAHNAGDRRVRVATFATDPPLSRLPDWLPPPPPPPRP